MSAHRLRCVTQEVRDYLLRMNCNVAHEVVLPREGKARMFPVLMHFRQVDMESLTVKAIEVKWNVSIVAVHLPVDMVVIRDKDGPV